MKNILLQKLEQKHRKDLEFLCNEVWATYSEGIAASVSLIRFDFLTIEIFSQESFEIPVLFCRNEMVPNFSFHLLILFNDENPFEDIHFLFTTVDENDNNIYVMSGYMYKIFQDNNNGNINRTLK